MLTMKIVETFSTSLHFEQFASSCLKLKLISIVSLYSLNSHDHDLQSTSHLSWLSSWIHPPFDNILYRPFSFLLLHIILWCSPSPKKQIILYSLLCFASGLDCGIRYDSKSISFSTASFINLISLSIRCIILFSYILPAWDIGIFLVSIGALGLLARSISSLLCFPSNCLVEDKAYRRTVVWAHYFCWNLWRIFF